MGFDNVTESQEEVKDVFMNLSKSNLVEVVSVDGAQGEASDFEGAFRVMRVDKNMFSVSSSSSEGFLGAVQNFSSDLKKKLGIEEQTNGLKLIKKETGEEYYAWVVAGNSNDVFIAKDTDEYKNNPEEYAKIVKVGYPLGTI